MVMRTLGCEFGEAVHTVKPLINGSPVAAVVESRITPEYLRGIFKGSTKVNSANLVGLYLSNRGLTLFPPTLRFHPGLKEPESGRMYPCMLGIVQMPDGTAATMHRTFLSEDGNKAPVEKPKKLLPGLQKLTGGAIRLFSPKDGMIGIAEGIETAIACTMTGIPTWSAVSAVLLEGFEPPKDITTVIVYGDNDLNYTGQAAAYRLANKLAIKGLRVDVDIPEEVGDFLDMLKKGGT